MGLATIDPNGEDSYDAYHRYHMDWDGKEAQYIADTADPIRYQNDIRLTNNGNNYGQAGQIWRIQGRRFLFVEPQSGSFFAIYRFEERENGEVAIPCGGLDYGNGIDWVTQPVTNQEFIWRDLNGNGIAETNEFVTPPNARHVDGQQWWVDTDGDIWQIAYYSSIESSIHFRRYRFQGFDRYGAPIYDYDHVESFTVPSELTDVQSIQFDPNGSNGGTLYLAGNQYTPTYSGAFTVVARYDHWDKGNRKAAWVKTVPWDPDPNNPWAPNQFRVAGDYLFIDYQEPHYVLIFRNKDHMWDS